MYKVADFPHAGELLMSQTSQGSVMSNEGKAQEPNTKELSGSAAVRRRGFLKGVGAAGLALTSGVAFANAAFGAEESSGTLDRGDAAILRFLAAAEIIEADLWQQYAELGGLQTNEPPLITGLIGGNPAYTKALSNLDGDMDTYIHDRSEER